MHPDQDTRVHLFSLPVELYHQIIFFLDTSDFFALRKTCKYFLALTQDRGLWLMMFTHLCSTQALPCSRTEFEAMSSCQARHVLFSAPRVEASFLELRERVAHHISAVKRPMNASSSLRILTFISDRLLLSVDADLVVIWDTSTLPSSSFAVASTPWAHFTLPSLSDYVVCSSTLYMATIRVHKDHRSAVIHSVPLSPSGEGENNRRRLQLEAEFPLHEKHSLKHVDPSSGRALLHFPPASIHILHWRDGNRRLTISVQQDYLDQGWNGITSMRFCGPYVLCFRVCSVEAYPIPTDTPTADPLPTLRHQFGPVCFRAVSLSNVHVSHRPSGDVYTIFMLTHDVYQGMFHYHIRLTTVPVPTMSVRVLAKCTIRPSEPLPFIPGTDTRYVLEDIVRRMFFSTWSLGQAGLRGVWVDRQRGSIDRRVVAFTTHPSRLRDKEMVPVQGEDSVWDRVESDKAPAMEGKVVHVMSSYDLRDDITTCAVSEWTGRIALGSRVGGISLL